MPRLWTSDQHSKEKIPKHLKNGRKRSFLTIYNGVRSTFRQSFRSGSGSRKAKIPRKKEEKKRISCFEEIEVLHGFYRSFEILHGDPIRNILKLLIYRMWIFPFMVSKSWIRPRFNQKLWSSSGLSEYGYVRLTSIRLKSGQRESL